MKLFGGAFEVELPKDRSFFDASTVRPVPDYQEVLVDDSVVASFIFELLETPSVPVTEEAGKSAAFLHFDTLAEENNAEIMELKEGNSNGEFSHVSGVQRLEGQEHLIYLAVRRMKRHDCDIVMTLNVPTGEEIRKIYNENVFLQVFSSLRCVDERIFGKIGEKE
jgi:hypothetical protein